VVRAPLEAPIADAQTGLEAGERAMSTLISEVAEAFAEGLKHLQIRYSLR